MNKFLISTLLAGFVSAGAASAATVDIDFDDLGTGGIAVGASYAGLGVTFVDAETTSFGSLPGGTPPTAIAHVTGTVFGPATPITALFSVGVSSVSLTGLDIGEAGFVLKAFASGGALLDSATVFGTGAGIGETYDLTVFGPAIAKVEFSQAVGASTVDGAAFDNFSFETIDGVVPVPASLPLMLAGLGGLVALRRRRKG